MSPPPGGGGAGGARAGASTPRHGPVGRLIAGLARWWAGQPAALRWAAVAGAAAVLWWAATRRMAGPPPTTAQSLLHNALHVIAYAGLASLLLPAWRGRLPWRSRDAVIVAAITTAYGGLTELLQSAVPGRVPSVADAVANGAGAALAVAILLGLGDRELPRGPLVASVLAAVGAVVAATFLPW